MTTPAAIRADRIEVVAAFPPALDLRPVARRPTVLCEETLAAVLAADPARLRAAESDSGDKAQPPVASIAVVTFGGLAFTRLCLESLLVNTLEPSWEVIVVDNGSQDGTPDYLRHLAELYPQVRPIFNDDNRGFAPAVNQALTAAYGEILVLLNNDTIVSPGWLSGIERHLADGGVGLVGAVTNRIGNEAEVEVEYRTYDELLEFAEARAREQRGASFDLRTPLGFCVGLRRDVYERVGPLDERFEVGLFEDEDLAMRCRQAGLRAVCAEDVFVHHFGEGSFGSLFSSGEHSRVFEANRRRFEQKWGEPWHPQRRRETPAYAALRERVRAAAGSLPADATVAVVSRGDDELLRLGGRTAWHFPRGVDGAYAGSHPADSDDAIAQIERVRAKGAEFVLFPATASWWLDHYEGLRRHLEGSYRVAYRQNDCCTIFALDLKEG